ncbi:hypothetical protein FEM48_Zijuj08G0192500 [Ziziphus jujuba var. spinosa]|uniref:glutathione transferase n=1 Tax=Ziziphus jujuba var. spinosa TaxID=714518 RepID=A0A978V0W3_ZIZJJ|nr:hypothetical protein FEM48_Zijuj08G0192500 [Ziziphus jujuba var. spinosa]
MVSQSNHPLKLYSYWRSSCSYRVRIALNLKGLDYEYIPINLVKGEQFSPEFRKLNPIGYVPVLVDGDVVISDSFAILLYLDEKYPQRPLLPTDIRKKAINYQKYIEEKVSPDEKLPWVQWHIGKGFESLEMLLKDYAGKYATGDDIFLQILSTAVRSNHTADKSFRDDKLHNPNPADTQSSGRSNHTADKSFRDDKVHNPKHDAIVHGDVPMADRFLLDSVACLHVDFLDANCPSSLEQVDRRDCKCVEAVDGSYKINVDGALKEEDGVRGVDVVIRNADGK